MTGSCEHGNEPSGSIKDEELLIRLVFISYSSRTLLHGISYF